MDHVVREYERPHHVTRFLKESIAAAKYSIQVLLNDSSLVLVIPGDA